MRLSITQKLVLAFLGLTLTVLIATLGLARWSFERGFQDYVYTLEQNRLEWMRDVLAREYESSGGNWESMTPRRFDEILSFVIAAPLDQVVEGNLIDPPPGGPPPRRGPRPPPDGGFGEPRPPEHRRGRLGPPTALFDKNSRNIAGDELDDPAAEHIRVPIVVDGEIGG